MNIVKDYIFPENKLGSDQIEAIVSEASGSSIDLSDLYIQYTTVESWTCEDGIVKNGSQQIDSGYGIRAISNEKGKTGHCRRVGRCGVSGFWA